MELCVCQWQEFTPREVSAVHYGKCLHITIVAIFSVSKPGTPISRQACSVFQHQSLLSCCQCIQSTWL